TGAVHFEDALPRRFQNGPQTVSQLASVLIDALTVRDVVHKGAERINAVVVVYRPNRQFDGKLPSDSMHGRDLDLLVELRSLSGTQIPGKAGPVGFPVLGRHDQVGQIPTNGVLAGPAERRL